MTVKDDKTNACRMTIGAIWRRFHSDVEFVDGFGLHGFAAWRRVLFGGEVLLLGAGFTLFLFAKYNVTDNFFGRV